MHIEFPGTLHEEGDEKIRVDIDAKPLTKNSAPRLLVCVHGSHSSGFEYEDVATALESSPVNVARITTSRHGDFDPTAGEPFFAEDGQDFMTRGFVGKTYDMEIEDVRRALQGLLDRSNELFGVPKEKLRLDIIGTSLGATIVSQLLGEFGSSVDLAILASPAAEIPPEDPTANRPILDTFPSQDAFLEPLKYYEGRVVFIRGERDVVIPESEVKKYRDAAPDAQYIVIDGAGHSFGLFDFEQSEEEQGKARSAFVAKMQEVLGS